SMPGLVKIGRTDRNTSRRADELSSHTGIPTEFIVAKEFQVEDAGVTERKIHERLSEYRVSENREFFKLLSEYAIIIIESLLSTSESNIVRDFEEEDELLAQATEIAVALKTVHLGMIAGLLNISYDEAEYLIRTLRGRGIIDEHNTLTVELLREHERWLSEQRRRERVKEHIARLRVERHHSQIQQVKELLGDLIDPETEKPVEISFDRDDEDLVVQVRGSTWLTAEARRRLAHLS